MAILPSNSFYSSFAKKKQWGGGYQAPVSAPWQGVANAPAAPKPPPAPAPSPIVSPSGPVGAPAGFTVTQGSLPPDPAYQLTIGGLTGTRDTTLAGLGQERTAYLSSAGYTEDPTTHAIAFDPNNPYSQAALLRKHFQEAKAGNQNSYADSGQGYAGSLSNAQNAATDSFNASDNTLTNAVIRFLANNTIQQTNANNAYTTGAGSALAQSVQSAPNNPLYNPASIGGAGGGVISGDVNGNMAITAANGPVMLAHGPANGTVQLATGYSLIYGPDGKLTGILDPNGNRVQ